MPGAFGHLIGAWICGRLYERIRKVNLTRLMWAALLFGAIAPDADFLFEWTIEDFYPHRIFTHSLTAVILSGIFISFVLIIFSRIGKMHITKPLFVATLFSLGIFSHILLDLTTSASGVQVLWPFSNEWITFNGPLNHPDGTPTYAQLKWFVNMATIDMGLGVAWIAYLFWRKKLSFN